MLKGSFGEGYVVTYIVVRTVVVMHLTFHVRLNSPVAEMLIFFLNLCEMIPTALLAFLFLTAPAEHASG